MVKLSLWGPLREIRLESKMFQGPKKCMVSKSLETHARQAFGISEGRHGLEKMQLTSTYFTLLLKIHLNLIFTTVFWIMSNIRNFGCCLGNFQALKILNIISFAVDGVVFLITAILLTSYLISEPRVSLKIDVQDRPEGQDLQNRHTISFELAIQTK